MSAFPKNNINTVTRVPRRAVYEREVVNAILDEGIMCHAGLIQNNQPVVIPTMYARDGDAVIIHGSTESRLMQYSGSGQPICLTVTLSDGLVLARSLYNHSMNYRSVVLFGCGSLIEVESERVAALERLSQHIIPGRWGDARVPNAREVEIAAVARITIESASAKVRTGPPIDFQHDYELDVWAGVIPMRTSFGPAENDSKLSSGIAVPHYVRDYQRGQ